MGEWSSPVGALVSHQWDATSREREWWRSRESAWEALADEAPASGEASSALVADVVALLTSERDGCGDRAQQLRDIEAGLVGADRGIAFAWSRVWGSL